MWTKMGNCLLLQVNGSTKNSRPVYDPSKNIDSIDFSATAVGSTTRYNISREDDHIYMTYDSRGQSSGNSVTWTSNNIYVEDYKIIDIICEVSETTNYSSQTGWLAIRNDNTVLSQITQTGNGTTGIKHLTTNISNLRRINICGYNSGVLSGTGYIKIYKIVLEK